MGFLSGRVTYRKCSVAGFSGTAEDVVARLKASLDAAKVESADGVNVRWGAGRSVFDQDFNLERNVIADAICFDLVVEVNKLPGDLLKAYAAQELAALSKDNPSGKPSAKQKREAKEIARERLEDEGKDGRFLKRKAIPLLWDLAAGVLYYGASSATQFERLVALFVRDFAASLSLVAAGTGVDADILPGHEHAPDWVKGSTPDYVGNDFIQWLWWTATESDTVKLGDGSEVTFMLANVLELACPNTTAGTDIFKHEGPTRLPEAFKALQGGKLPRKAGLTLVRHDLQYELTLQPEAMVVSSAKLPKEEESGRAKLEERIGLVRHLDETLTGLFQKFMVERVSHGWAVTRDRMNSWLGRSAPPTIASQS